MNKFYKTKVVLPIILGMVIGGGLFILGELDDAPGLCAIGLSIGFILIMLGVKKTGMIPKGLLLPGILLSFSVFIALITTSILIDGEFGDKPWFSAFGFTIALALFIIGLLKLRIFFRSK